MYITDLYLNVLKREKFKKLKIRATNKDIIKAKFGKDETLKTTNIKTEMKIKTEYMVILNEFKNKNLLLIFPSSIEINILIKPRQL